MALFLFAKNFLAGKPIDVFNLGHPIRDYTHVDDIAEAVVRSRDRIATPDPATSNEPYRVYSIRNNRPVDLSRYLGILEQYLGMKAQKNLLPLQPGDVPDTCADVEDLVHDVGDKPGTTVEQGVKAFVDWYRAYYKA
jgi:UDP-glucuronate 4-epimerase